MLAWISRGGTTYGPYTLDQVRAWTYDGTLSAMDTGCVEGGAWTTVGALLGHGTATPLPPPMAAGVMPPPMIAGTPPFLAAAAAPPMVMGEAQDEALVRRIADYERISAIVWAVIAAIQILSVVGIIAGLWNAYASWTRFQLVPHIIARNRGVPAAFESTTGLVIIGLINLFLGGVFGVLGIIMDFVVRDYVLKNEHLFDRELAEELPV